MDRMRGSSKPLRRCLAGAVAVFASAVLLSGDMEHKRTDAVAATAVSASVPETAGSTLSPERYIRSVAERMPSYARAKDTGVIDGIAYECGKKEAERRMRDSLKASGYGSGMDVIVANALEIFKASRNNPDGGATVIPPFGPEDLPGVRRTIVIFEKGLRSETMRGRRELENLIEHELQHAEDFYYGIGKVEPLAGGLAENGWDLDLWMKILELRAQHRQMMDIFGQDVKTEGALLSRGWIAVQVRRYYRLWSYVKDYRPKNKEWGKIRDSQLDAVRDIIPKREGRNVSVLLKSGQRQDGITIGYESESQLEGSDF